MSGGSSVVELGRLESRPSEPVLVVSSELEVVLAPLDPDIAVSPPPVESV